MKRGITLLMLILFTIALPLVAKAESAVDSKTDDLTALCENAIILSDAQLADIKGGLTFGGEIYISIPDIGVEIGIVGLEVEIIIGRPPTVQVTPPEVNVDMPAGQGMPSLPLP